MLGVPAEPPALCHMSSWFDATVAVAVEPDPGVT